MKKYKMTFDSLEEAHGVYCSRRGFEGCDNCQLCDREVNGTKYHCTEFAKQFPDKAAEIMGVELVEVD